MYYSACLQIESHFVISCLCFLPPWNHFYYAVLLVNVFLFLKKKSISQFCIFWKFTRVIWAPVLRPLVKQLSAPTPNIDPDACTGSAALRYHAPWRTPWSQFSLSRAFHPANGTRHVVVPHTLPWLLPSHRKDSTHTFISSDGVSTISRAWLHGPQEAQVFTHHFCLWICVTSH